MMGRRQILKSGDEYDCVDKAPLCVFDRAGVRKKTKRRLNKRFRKEFKVSLIKSLKDNAQF